MLQILYGDAPPPTSAHITLAHRDTIHEVTPAHYNATTRKEQEEETDEEVEKPGEDRDCGQESEEELTQVIARSAI